MAYAVVAVGASWGGLHAIGVLLEHLPAVVEGGVVIAPMVAAGLAERFTESIHHQAELSRALEQSTKRLQAIESAKEAFIANVNRELRTPLTIVRGIAHLLKNGTLSEEDESQFVERIEGHDSVEYRFDLRTADRSPTT